MLLKLLFNVICKYNIIFNFYCYKYFRDISEWYKLQLEFARFSQIPIGNLENDYPIFVSDVLYARILKKNKHLLWISDTSRPDLGGSEEDDNSFGKNLNKFF